ncbi:glycosyltransferase family 2 protein [Sphingomonas hankyongi]|uniref:Glycosyltransferase family 2 protein n=1 Tax=Sphingomonas hankyongi TaxID=2908209 RepID=A0ABT0S2P6_9SPHN|nr:glycosyltransferase family 2 protein [Sphingomonas hankyongi]MCL6730127.1 glycosyltransferase family 2 protein [Sphingomonas hankyongi]
MIFAVICAAFLALPALMFTVECLLGLRPLRGLVTEPAPPFAVLVPAHDEALGIEETVAAIRAELRPDDHLLVVADNCSDDTANLARRSGACVVERDDANHRGKGFALAFGRDELADVQPAVVIVIDADCRPAAGTLKTLASVAASRQAATQCLNLIERTVGSSPLVAISSFAFLVKNLVRQRGLARLGAPGILQGTGMAFPWPLFASVPLATGDIVEDLNMGQALLREGKDIVWTEAGQVTSMPASQKATMTQRTRWEHGFLSSAIVNAPALLRAAVEQRRLALVISALDLFVPPIALLVMVLIIGSAAAAAFGIAAGDFAPFAIITVSLGAIVFAVLLAWFAEGRKIVSLKALLAAPLYIVWKLPIYLKLLGARQKGWVRTARE